MIRFEGAGYEICGENTCILASISGKSEALKVPAAVFSKEGEIYRIIGISSQPEGVAVNSISFDEQSEITVVPAWIIRKCRLIFVLPPRIKRIQSIKPSFFSNRPKIVPGNCDQRFVSTCGSHITMNNFPLELVFPIKYRKRYIIRETTRFISSKAFEYNNNINFVVFPSSVECIGDFSFNWCKNLRFIKFKRNSKLKRIGKSSFSSTAIKSADIPANVEVIEDSSFAGCEDLKSITFSKDSRLKRIGAASFHSTRLEFINIPASVEFIGESSFVYCLKLKSIFFTNDSKLERIEASSFHRSSIESIVIPPSVEEIGDWAFWSCLNLRSVTFSEGSKLKKIGKFSFDSTSIEAIEIPANVEEVGGKAFKNNKELRTVTFLNESNIRLIGKDVFSECPYLTDLRLPRKSAKSWITEKVIFLYHYLMNSPGHSNE